MKKIFISLLIIISSQILFAETDKELAQLYLDEAFYFYNGENMTKADEYLQKALEFSMELPESFYLSGLIREVEGNRLKALDMYRQSIRIGDVYSEFVYDLYFRYINLLNITAHHKDVLDFYHLNQKYFDSDNQIVLKVSDSAFKYGLVDLSIQMASDVYERNPYNLKSLIYLIRSTGDPAYYEKIQQSLHLLEKDKFDEILFQEIILEDSQSSRESITDLYKSIFGDTGFLHMIENRAGTAVEGSRNLMIRSSGKEKLKDGVYFGDYNFDGVSDEIVTVSENELTFLKDENQDNITDISIHFTNGIPSGVYLNRGDLGYEFKYSDYPYMEEVIFSNKKLKRIYKIYPGTAYTPLRDLNSFNWKYNKKRDAIVEDFTLTPVDLLKMSYRFDEYFSDNKNVFREYTLKGGEVTGIREDSRDSGMFDHFLEISAWQPESGKRDINGDGIIDVYEYYEDGKIIGIAVDWNNNGKSEYLEDWSVLNIKTWDFNEDSYMDAEYINSPGNELYHSVPVEKSIVNHYDIYSWDFTFENFWFNNN